MEATISVHAACVGWPMRGAVLIRGASGSGKSDLALRLVYGGACLVADDQVQLRVRERVLIASAPHQIKGLIEIFGHGIVRLDDSQLLQDAPVKLVVDLLSATTVPERMPKPAFAELSGCSLPLLRLDPDWPGAEAKIFASLGRPLVESLA